MSGHHAQDFEMVYQPTPVAPPQPTGLMEVSTLVELIEKVGIPACVILAAFWYIRFMSLQAKTEREEMWQKDTQNDERIMSLVESTTAMMAEMQTAISSLKLAVESNSQTMKELIHEWRFMNRDNR